MPKQGGHSSEAGSGIVLNDILIWILIPTLSYLAGALFQAGFNNYFGLPDSLVTADPVAIFHASRSYLDLIVHHFSLAVAIPLAFLVYLAILPDAYYRKHAAVVLALAGIVLFVSFSVRPFAWAIACGIVLVAFQVAQIRGHRLPLDADAHQQSAARIYKVSPVAVKSLAIVAFFYATLFSAGQQSARFQTQFFVGDSNPRYVMLALDDKGLIAAELLDPNCKPVRALPLVLSGYHFAEQFKIFAIGDSDTPAFRLYETDGLTSSAACKSLAH